MKDIEARLSTLGMLHDHLRTSEMTGLGAIDALAQWVISGQLPDARGETAQDAAAPAKASIEPATVSFDAALLAVKAGARIARDGWNGAGMFVYLVPAAAHPAQTPAARARFGRSVPYRAYLALVTAQGDVATWSPSCSDVLADDWRLMDAA